MSPKIPVLNIADTFKVLSFDMLFTLKQIQPVFVQ